MIDAEGSRLLADVFNTLTEEQKNIMPEDVAERIERFMTANGFRMVFSRWFLQCEQEVKQEPVAWVEVVDSYEGPYEFHGAALLGIGRHNLYTFPPDAQAEIAKRDARIAELEERLNEAVGGFKRDLVKQLQDCRRSKERQAAEISRLKALLQDTGNYQYQCVRCFHKYNEDVSESGDCPVCGCTDEEAKSIAAIKEEGL